MIPRGWPRTPHLRFHCPFVVREPPVVSAGDQSEFGRQKCCWTAVTSVSHLFHGVLCETMEYISPMLYFLTYSQKICECRAPGSSIISLFKSIVLVGIYGVHTGP